MGAFPVAKGAVKMHTLLDLRGNIPSFVHISDGKMHDGHALDLLPVEAGAIYVMDRGYVDFARLFGLHQSGAFFVTRAKSNLDARRIARPPVDRTGGLICDQTVALMGYQTSRNYPDHLRRIRLRDPSTAKTLIFLTNNFELPAACLRSLQKSMAGRALLQMDQAAPAHQALLWHLGERREDPDLDRRLGLRPHRDRQKAPEPDHVALHFAAGFFGQPFRKIPINQHSSKIQLRKSAGSGSQLNLFSF